MQNVAYSAENFHGLDRAHCVTIALCEAVRQALASNPDNDAVVHGAMLALNGRVTLIASDVAAVTSVSGECRVVVGETCTCPAAQRTPDDTCKHTAAVCLVRRGHRLLEEAVTLDQHQGGTCPQCRHATVMVDSTGGVQWLVCRFAVLIGAERIPCRWRAVIQ